MLGQRKLLQRLVPGLMHAAIFWGFIVLFPTIVIATIAAVDRTATLPWLGHQGWFAALVDLFAVLVLLGVATAVAIRKLVRPARFEGTHLGEAELILALIAGVVLTLLLWHAARIAAGLNEWPAAWSPVSEGSRTSSAAARQPESASGSSCGRTWRSSSRSSSTSRTRSTCTSRPPRRTSSSAARGSAAGSSRCGSTCPRTSCASASVPSPTSRGRRCSTSSRAPSAAAARTRARPGRPARCSRRSCS